MATLMSAALTLLGQDLDDGWTGETTQAGDGGGGDLVDTNLYEKVADWVSDGMIVYLPDGPSGSGTAETRVAKTLVPPVLVFETDFSAQVASGVKYEVHRLFTRTQKLVALRNSATLIFPGVHTVIRDMSKQTADNQYEFDISSLSIHRNHPHQVLLAQQIIREIWVKSTAYVVGDYVRPTGLSTFTGLTYKCTEISGGGASNTTEPTWPTTAGEEVVDNEVTWTTQEDLDYSNYPMLPLHDWDVTPDGKLFLNASYAAGYKLMIVGIKPLAFTGADAAETIALDSPFDLILSAQAALYLCSQRAGSAGTQNVERWTQLAQVWAQKLAMRKAQYWMKPPDGTIITGAGLTV